MTCGDFSLQEWAFCAAVSRVQDLEAENLSQKI
jgi:hypothetical protein